MVAPVDLKRTDYRTVLLGMKPEKTYHFRVVASDGTTTYASEDHLLATGAKNTASLIASFSVSDAAKLATGFFVASFWYGTNAEMPFIFDTDGDVVWWYQPASGESTDGVAQAKMSADGQSVWLVNETLSGAPLRRVSIDGLESRGAASSATSSSARACTASRSTSRNERGHDDALVDEASAIRDGGGFGSIIGRNAFQRPEPAAKALLARIMEVFD